MPLRTDVKVSPLRMSQTTNLDMRVGDAERHACANRLAEACELGLLTRDEFDNRLALALSASRIGDLAELTYDLPPVGPPVGATLAPRRSSGPSPWVIFDVLIAVLTLCAMLCLIPWQLLVFHSHEDGFIAVMNGLGAAVATGGSVHLLHRIFVRKNR